MDTSVYQIFREAERFATFGRHYVPSKRSCGVTYTHTHIIPSEGISLRIGKYMLHFSSECNDKKVVGTIKKSVIGCVRNFLAEPNEINRRALCKNHVTVREVA